MTDKRIIYIDIVDTLVPDSHDESRQPRTQAELDKRNLAAKLIFDFAQAANEADHEVKAYSSNPPHLSKILINDCKLYKDEKTDFLFPAVEKQSREQIEEKIAQGNSLPLYDIIIDDDPTIPADNANFFEHAKKWINPYSETLEQDLMELAGELEFVWTPPEP